MSTTIYAKYINLEDFSSRLLDVVKSSDPSEGPEHDLFFEEEIFSDENIELGSYRMTTGYGDIFDLVRPRLPSDIGQRLDLFLGMLLHGLIGKRIERDTKFSEELYQINLDSWILDQDEIRIVKESATFIHFLHEHKDAFICGLELDSGNDYDRYDFFLLLLKKWIEVVEVASQQNCELLIYLL